MQEWAPLVAVMGCVAAVVFGIVWRRSESRIAALQTQHDSLRAKRSELEAELSREQKGRRRQAEELAEFRKRADKAKRRSGKQPAQPLGTSARIGDLEAALETTGRERDRIRNDRDGLANEVAQLKARVESHSRAAAAAEARATALASAPPASIDGQAGSSLVGDASSVGGSSLVGDSRSVGDTSLVGDTRPAGDAGSAAELAEARERIQKLESEHRLARQNEARMRKRMDNQEQLYASVRSELEVKKDRLRTQEEQLQRLQALKVAVLD